MPVETLRPSSETPGWKGAALLALICAVLALVASSDALHDALIRLLNAVGPLIRTYPAWGISLFVLFSAVSAMLAFFSTAVMVPAAITTWGAPATILLLWIGWLLGGISAYALARFLGRPVVKTLTTGEALASFEHRITARAPFRVVLLFQLAVPSEVPGYILGLARYSFHKYMLVLGIGELPYTVGTVYLGTSFLERRATALIAVGVLGALFVAWAFKALQRRIAEYNR